MSLASVIDKFRTHTGLVVTRKNPPTVTNGRAVAAGQTTFTINASIQPLSERDLLALPEGQRTEENRLLFTRTELRTLTSAGGPDSIVIDGETWVVSSSSVWSTLSLYYRAIIHRQANP